MVSIPNLNQSREIIVSVHPGRPDVQIPRPEEIVPGQFHEASQLSVDQRKKLAEIQRTVDDQLEKLLTLEQREKWNRFHEARLIPFSPPGGSGK